MNRPIAVPNTPATEGLQSGDRVAEVLRQIDQYLTLEADWDLEGALPIDREAATLASQLVQTVERTAWQQGIPWEAPITGPDADGGIDLVWEGAGRRTLLMTRPGQLDTVMSVMKAADAPPVRQTVSIRDAVEHALWALRS